MQIARCIADIVDPDRAPRPSPRTFSGRALGASPATVDGAAGAVWARGGVAQMISGFTVFDGRIVEIDLLADPDRLRMVSEA